MGLHLCYELSLPGDCPEAGVAERVAALRERARALPFDGVSDVVRLDERTLAEPRPLRGLAYESLEHVVHLGARFDRDALYREWLGLGEDDEYEVVDEYTRVYRPVTAPPDVPTSAIGSAVAPGREMNRVVARFAGAFTDAVRDAGGDSRQVDGAIFEHPDFERLEGGESDTRPPGTPTSLPP